MGIQSNSFATYVGRDKYLTTSGGAYELIFCRSGRYQSIGNDVNGWGRGNSNGRGNQQNQRQNIMFLQQDINKVNSNGFPPEDQIVPGKDGSTWCLELYYFYEWGHISNNCPQIPYDRVRDRGGGSGGGAHTGRISYSRLLHFRVFFAQHADGIIPRSWIVLNTFSASSVCNNESIIVNVHYCTSDKILTVYINGGSNNFTII